MLASRLRSLLSQVRSRFRHAVVTEPTGRLDVSAGPATFIMAVGASFDQRRPDAMMTCRMGYCHAFEDLGIPYIIADVRDLETLVETVPNPVSMYFGGDVHLLSNRAIERLRKFPSVVWLYPWFRHSDQFFAGHGLDPAPWTLPKSVQEKILKLEPRFGFTATVPSGLGFFEEWARRSVPVKSLPLACDTRLYTQDPPVIPEFAGVKMAFVGGYWPSKGKQIDQYLRKFEDALVIYGYNEWPYSGYRGQLDARLEASLYRQALLSPAVNEPTVRLLKGQINERVFKVFGSYGCTVVDDVPAYRELYGEDELLVSEGPEHFAELVRKLLLDEKLNLQYRKKGFDATMGRHTYGHRVETILRELGLEHLLTFNQSQ